jgi:hypothetical protein
MNKHPSINNCVVLHTSIFYCHERRNISYLGWRTKSTTHFSILYPTIQIIFAASNQILYVAYLFSLQFTPDYKACSCRNVQNCWVMVKKQIKSMNSLFWAWKTDLEHEHATWSEVNGNKIREEIYGSRIDVETDNVLIWIINMMLDVEEMIRVRVYFVTMTCNVSTPGKHLRKVGSILASLRIPNRTLRAKILTLGTMLAGLILVPACSISNKSWMRREIIHTTSAWHEQLSVTHI